MDEKEQVAQIKAIVDDCMDYGCNLLVDLLHARVTQEEFARDTRIKYRDALNTINLILDPMPTDKPVVQRRLI